ncbi:YhfC family intramembrane metalloprotease [Bacillus carboniphilus]|uniref:YhfC family intramembrane metalloprotease n=1 Tax=Bacillus carboniphilus TaxID=86663 RepID=A0ABY9JV54_9BACI|nr:YhfC family intramembrane metalloprotease [Bacillus carboniphilus]WLR43272.1 YhfC family intramembrane metalloprotease [Bacillus carboniphilus]
MIEIDVFISAYVAMALSVLLLVLIILLIWKKKWLSWKSVGMGILIFIVFALVLEQLLHIFLIDRDSGLLKFSNNPYLFVLYGCLAAGIFEEVGRYVGFRFLLRKNREFGDGLSYGLGHGGIEVIVVTFLSLISLVIISTFINQGMFDALFSESLTADQLNDVKDQYLNMEWFMPLISFLERIPALALHLSLSLLVLLSVKRKKKSFLLLAIGFHAIFNFFPGLYQADIVPLWFTEVIIWIFGIGCFWFIIKSRKLFDGETDH